ncbi:MAG: FKBP-type peptidyl-prolyl cis-trans isomerase 1 [Ilumatobacteraceae bacterium]|nr:FKBP-type peptidyl-prolyl cis-trans isomerase 1 [Ilumatobacteraceae bacterium]
MHAVTLATTLAVTMSLLAACGSGSKSGTASTTAGSTAASTASSTADSATASTSADKPKVKIPATLPTKLVITDLIEGTGPAAKVGDTIAVNYVGVRSADGTEFDNSYDRGQTFPVTLGANSVIQGWEQGLIGMKQGGRRQLDIPADLAYGDQPQGDVIKAGDALSFVIDAVSITPGIDVPKADVADKPKVDISTSVGATKTSFTDLVVGTGEEAVAGDTAYLQIIAYRGDTGAEIQSTWEAGTAAKIALDDTTVTGLVTGVTGMKVGGRREIIVPPTEAFGAEGSDTMGLPAGADLILVVDLVLLSQSTG